MFCTACGTAIPEGQAFCSNCGQPRANDPQAAVPPAPGMMPPPNMGYELEQYRSHIKILAICWFVYGGLSLLLGFAGLSFAHMFVDQFASRMQGYNLPPGLFSMGMHLAWVALIVRAALSLVAGWGLLQGERWGRIVAIIVAILTLIRIPLGTAMGIWTLVMLFGYRHTALYEQL